MASPDCRLPLTPLNEVVDGQDQDAVGPVLARDQLLDVLKVTGWEDLGPRSHELAGPVPIRPTRGEAHFRGRG